MKYTEGYWLRKENIMASFASQAFRVRPIENGMRVTAPERPIHSRADALDLTVLTIDFVSAGHNDIAVTLYHDMGYESREPRFSLDTAPDSVELRIDDDEAEMRAGDITVKVDRNTCACRFEAGGKLLTSWGFRNVGYLRVNKTPSFFEAGPGYFQRTWEPYMLTELSLKPQECVYGFGERFTPFVKNGQTVEIWNEDGGTASAVSYKNVPFYMTNEHYGVFVDSTDHVSFECASEKVEYVSFTVPGEVMRWHLFYGERPADIIEAYTALTGRPAMIPPWSFGLWLSTSFKPSYDETTVSEMIEGMEKRNIPLSVFHFDCYWLKALHWCDFRWDEEQFPDVRAMLARYHGRGLKICAWINPYVAQDTEMFEEGKEKGYFLMRSDGRGIKQVDNWQPGLALVDFTNPAAAKWYAGKIRDLLDMGIDCVKTDFGERIPVDVSYYDGSDPAAMHNYYSFLYNQTVFREIERIKGKDQALVFARSATAGSQQFPVHWGGDCFASYASMAETLRGGLSFLSSGFAYWSHDISGFEATASPDLYKRWVQFGLLSSHSRLHGSDTYRVPWVFDEESCEVLRRFVNLKCTLMPYLYTLTYEAHEKGTPLMRPMFFEFPDDPGCRTLDLQYMLGDSLLVAPVFNEEGTAEFFLPAGHSWTNYLDGEVLSGGRWYRRTYDYFHMPLFVKNGTILPVGSNDQRPDYDYTEGLDVFVAGAKEGELMTRIVRNTDGKELLITAQQKDGHLIVEKKRK
ncbi:MAG: alpha-xylosidase [Lachnospiraceae bacterium]|nr:alpha-xylosidase [Lachnospiraceae bacterium]